jgi:hypothetical protein
MGDGRGLGADNLMVPLRVGMDMIRRTKRTDLVGVTALDALYRVLHRYDRTQGYFCRTRV